MTTAAPLAPLAPHPIPASSLSDPTPSSTSLTSPAAPPLTSSTSPSSASASAASSLRSLLNHTVHVHTLDHRLFVGPLLSIDRSASLLLSPCNEYAAPPLPTSLLSASSSGIPNPPTGPTDILHPSSPSNPFNPFNPSNTSNSSDPSETSPTVAAISSTAHYRAAVIDRYYPRSECYDGSGFVDPLVVDGVERRGRDLGMVLVPGKYVSKVFVEDWEGPGQATGVGSGLQGGSGEEKAKSGAKTAGSMLWDLGSVL